MNNANLLKLFMYPHSMRYLNTQIRLGKAPMSYELSKMLPECTQSTFEYPVLLRRTKGFSLLLKI